jgi:hypothetical protein
MTFVLQKKRIHGDAGKSGQQRRAEVIPQVRDPDPPAYL